jgi:hypothetical protein
MIAMDLLQLYNHLSLLTLAGSLLAILGLRFTTGLTALRIKLNREISAWAQRASRSCMRARSTALTLEFDTQANVVTLFEPERSSRHFVNESECLIRTLTTITKDSDDIRVSRMRRRPKALKRIEKESRRLLYALEIDRN